MKKYLVIFGVFALFVGYICYSSGLGFKEAFMCFGSMMVIAGLAILVNAGVDEKNDPYNPRNPEYFIYGPGSEDDNKKY